MPSSRIQRRQKPAWEIQYDKEMAQTERWLLWIVCCWLLMMLYVTISSGGDRQILAGFLLLTGISGLLFLGLFQMLEACCGLRF